MDKNATLIPELGPIRPPSEAMSLLIRVSRNCPWNKCAFCPVYKGEKFERRDEDDVLAEIDVMGEAAARIAKRFDGKSKISAQECLEVLRDPYTDETEKRVALWLSRGGEHVFLQDADSLIVPPKRVEGILKRLKGAFPTVNRVTTYARSRTLAAKTVDQLKALHSAGLTRIHVGVESGAKEVLDLVSKGCEPHHHIDGCTRAIEAGFEVCCYVMPGLGGKAHTAVHGAETGRVLREIDPHHVRLRSLYVMPGSPLFEMLRSDAFELVEDEQAIVEIQTILKRLVGARSHVVSDHDFNLMMEIKGHVTDDADALQDIISEFLDLSADIRDAFVVARRSGHFRTIRHFLLDTESIKNFKEAALRLKAIGDGSLAKGMSLSMGPRSI